MNDDGLTDAFERGEIEGSAFPHEYHVRVSWGLARRYPPDDAFRRLSAGIRDIAARAGRPSAFHVTITRAWFELVAAADDLGDHPELFDKTLLGRYYTPAALARGRDRWVEPDLAPLRLPPPADLLGVVRAIPTAVAVLAVRTPDTVHATTVSSLVSISRRPALLGTCLADGSRTFGLVQSAGAFALSVLAADQTDVAERFAGRDRPPGPAQFDHLAHHLDAYGPMLEHAAVWLGCDVQAIHPCGDQQLVIGRVRAGRRGDARPLVRRGGEYD